VGAVSLAIMLIVSVGGALRNDVGGTARFTAFTFTAKNYTEPGEDTLSSFAPCTGSNSWTASILPWGSWTGYAHDQADANTFCSPDTTEHEQENWVQSGTLFTPSVNGVYTSTAYFDGNISIWADNYGGHLNGYGTALFEIGVAIYQYSSIPSVPSFTWSTIADQTTDGNCPPLHF
jgi:hypothetical protein